jgi:hypothetical protein
VLGDQSAGGGTHSSGEKKTGSVTARHPTGRSKSTDSRANRLSESRRENSSNAPLAEDVPHPPQRQDGEAREQAEAAYRVVGRLELEEERLAGRDGAESARSGARS